MLLLLLLAVLLINCRPWGQPRKQWHLSQLLLLLLSSLLALLARSFLHLLLPSFSIRCCPWSKDRKWWHLDRLLPLVLVLHIGVSLDMRTLSLSNTNLASPLAVCNTSGTITATTNSSTTFHKRGTCAIAGAGVSSTAVVLCGVGCFGMNQAFDLSHH
jgi:hypothetical protein